MISDIRITSVESPLCFEITPFLYIETWAHQWPKELGFFSSSRNKKGTPLHRNEGGFAAADPKHFRGHSTEAINQIRLSNTFHSQIFAEVISI